MGGRATCAGGAVPAAKLRPGARTRTSDTLIHTARLRHGAARHRPGAAIPAPWFPSSAVRRGLLLPAPRGFLRRQACRPNGHGLSLRVADPRGGWATGCRAAGGRPIRRDAESRGLDLAVRPRLPSRLRPRGAGEPGPPVRRRDGRAAPGGRSDGSCQQRLPGPSHDRLVESHRSHVTTRTAPWHAAASDVYPDNTACTENNIERQNRRAGAGGKRKCQNCQRLQRQMAPRRSSPSRGR